MQTEPSVIVGTITGAATAIIALLVAYNVNITQDQQAAILGVIAVAAPIIASVVIRSKVWSPASVDQAIRDTRPTIGDTTEAALTQRD